MKTLYIVRGLPGSGKTTLARLIAPRSNVCNDDFHTDENGNYCFDPNKLMDSIKFCFNKTEWFMTENEPIIAVHNTFVLLEHIKPYVELAEKYGYSVNIIECNGRFGNIHDVPDFRLDLMKNAYQTIEKDWK